MSPEQLDAIREHHQRAEQCPCGRCRNAQEARIDRLALLTYVDTLERGLEGTLSRWRQQRDVRLAQVWTLRHLLAHQQARGIEAREEAEIHEAWRASLSQELAERAEGARLDSKERNALRAENERLKSEMRAAPEDYPNLLRINREAAAHAEAECNRHVAELARKDAETQRLREVLEEVRQTLRMRTEVVPGLGQVVLKADVDLLARVTAALGEEVRDAE